MTAKLRVCEVEPAIAAQLLRVGDQGWVLPAAMHYGAHRQLFVNGLTVLVDPGPGLVKLERKDTGLHADFSCVPSHRMRKMCRTDRPVRIHSYEGLRCDG